MRVRELPEDDRPDAGRMRMAVLAGEVASSKSRLSHQISRMEAKGLVKREDCRDDRRGTFAVLTDEGWETIQRVAPFHVGSVREHFVDRLTDEQLEAIEAAYSPLVEQLKKLA